MSEETIRVLPERAFFDAAFARMQQAARQVLQQAGQNS